MNFENYKQEMKSEQKCNMEYDGTVPAGYMPGMESCGADMMGVPAMGMGACCMPVYECPRENVCHRYICYEVPHIMPCNTRIINHHVYRHTYRPEYTCCEENVVSNVYDRPCC